MLHRRSDIQGELDAVGEVEGASAARAAWARAGIDHAVLPLLRPGTGVTLTAETGLGHAGLRTIRLTEQNLERVVSGLSDGRFEQLWIASDQGPILEVTTDDGQGLVRPTVVLATTYRTSMLGMTVTLAAERLREAMAVAAAAMHYGFISAELMNNLLTPREEAARASHGQGLGVSDRFARGAFWGNLLSDRHIDALGGADVVLRSAPCPTRTELGPGRIYLQLAGTPDKPDAIDLTELEAFLEPILLTEDQVRELREQGDV